MNESYPNSFNEETSIVFDIFKESRNFTKEEAKLYKGSINKLFDNTRRKLYDI